MDVRIDLHSERANGSVPLSFLWFPIALGAIFVALVTSTLADFYSAWAAVSIISGAAILIVAAHRVDKKMGGRK